MIVAAALVASRLTRNYTPSLPLGVYWLRPGLPVVRGEIVDLAIPRSAHDLSLGATCRRDSTCSSGSSRWRGTTSACPRRGLSGQRRGDLDNRRARFHGSATAHVQVLRASPTRNGIRRHCRALQPRLALLRPRPTGRPHCREAAVDLLTIILACSLHPDDQLVEAFIRKVSDANPLFSATTPRSRPTTTSLSADQALELASIARRTAGRAGADGCSGLVGGALQPAARRSPRRLHEHLDRDRDMASFAADARPRAPHRAWPEVQAPLRAKARGAAGRRPFGGFDREVGVQGFTQILDEIPRAPGPPSRRRYAARALDRLRCRRSRRAPAATAQSPVSGAAPGPNTARPTTIKPTEPRTTIHPTARIRKPSCERAAAQPAGTHRAAAGSSRKTSQPAGAPNTAPSGNYIALS